MRVPTTEGGLVERQGGTSARFQAADAGPGVGAGLEQLGRGLQQATDNQLQANALLDEAGAKDLDSQYVAHQNDVLHSGPDAYFQKRGKTALDAVGDVRDSLGQKATDLVAQATTPRMKRMLTDVLNQRLDAAQKSVGTFAGAQTYQYNKDETSGRIATASSAAGNAYLDPVTAEKNIATVRTEASSLAQMEGYGPDATSAFVLSKVSAARKDIASRIIAESPQGPEVGKAYLDKHAADLTSDDSQYLTHYVRTQADYYAAQAHKAEVEQRQELRAQTADARQKAEDYLNLAEAGPRPPAEIAGAMSAAQKVEALTGNNGLRLRVEKISTQNGVKVAYQNATPVELQDQINALAPKVRGGDAEAITRTGTLTQMLQQTSDQLKTDPISWGAAHMGIATGSIDWNNPASIGARAQSAQLIAARTGTQPKLLTNEEVAPLAQMAASHDLGQRRQLVGQLAKAGPQYGVAAARQIAPNDNALIGLVGLATIPNTGVANALVTKALNGPDAIKANPKLFGDKTAFDYESKFDQQVGGVFRAMDPGALLGIKEVSRNLLASNAAMAGIHDGAGLSRDANVVTRSINDALGAYNDNGVARGGLGNHAGKLTILPTGMSQPEFDAAIARSNASAVMAAGNGAPVWSNGKSLSSTRDLWGLEMVPVGDGRYRFANDSGYVARKGGGFFELDVRKLVR